MAGLITSGNSFPFLSFFFSSLCVSILPVGSKYYTHSAPSHNTHAFKWAEFFYSVAATYCTHALLPVHDTLSTLLLGLLIFQTCHLCRHIFEKGKALPIWHLFFIYIGHILERRKTLYIWLIWINSQKKKSFTYLIHVGHIFQREKTPHT